MQKIAGYTNHWSYQSGPNNPDGGFSDAQWATIVREARAIVAAAEEKGIEIAGGQRSGRPVINDEMILLNGAGRQGHESFYLPKTPSEEDRRFHMQFMESFGEQPGQEVARGFCKTDGKPYDAVVASILAVAKRVGKGVFKATTDNGAVKRVFASSIPIKTTADRVAERYVGASTTRVAYEPPFHNAAKADEALGEAYRSLIDLKLGFDSWDEIPSSAHPLYQQIMKAVDAVVTARQVTTQVRAMVARKRY